MRKHKPTTRPSKFANKRSKAQRTADLAEIATLALSGNTECQIADVLNGKRNYSLSRSQVHLDVVSLREQWAEAAGLDTAERINEELARLGHIERKAWRRFDDAGEPQWLGIVLRVISQRIQLLGLAHQQPTRLELSGQDGSPYQFAVLEVPERTFLDRNA